ncbi:hypothetical protein CEP52_004281 [Fusarium oligoseptatum]|uniref:Heterokaryon incompatibility domain-containing protein n=1 Tax=Fusarium oligoseptatum TaxID=2604345 RepID=A0A428U4N1_9HYPO|nr:hypothetical protein CEP52_004281 [Fusarium oligoseptatum]
MAKAIGAYFEISGENEEARRPQTSSLSLYLGNFQRELFLLGHLPGGEIGGKINLHYSRIATPSISTSPKCIIPNLVDWYRIQGWLSHCNQEHSCKRSGHSGVPEGFRLIDIENRCVTSEFGQDAKLGVDIKFAALSYVWGESNVSRDNALLNSNESEFGTDGGMKEGKVPQAIEDAITICKRLKQRYLWVDRFCIIQNNKDGREKQRQIDAMGDIYSSAEFTIIHASGKGIQCPIPGVSRERKVLQFGSVIAGLEITITYPDFKNFLEKLQMEYSGLDLPRSHPLAKEASLHVSRSLDQYSTQRTSPFADWGNRMTQFRMNTFSSSGILNFTNFAHHLESYTARSLTNQSDILNAFTGILASVYEGKRIFHGLPEYDFDQALLWYCKNNDRPTRWGESCPSWSWTSVSETVSAPVNDFISGFMGTLVWWVYRGPDTGLTAIRPRNSLQLQKDQDDGPQIHLLFAWWKGCIEAPIPENLERQLENYSKYMDDPDLTREWPTLKKVWDDIKKCPKRPGQKRSRISVLASEKKTNRWLTSYRAVPY